MKTIGSIDKQGNIDKEFFNQGFIYKNFDAFKNKSDEVCYISETDDDVLKEGVGINYLGLVNLCQEFIDRNEDVQEYLKSDEGKDTNAQSMAVYLFESLDWQFPSTEIDQWEIHGTFTLD